MNALQSLSAYCNILDSFVDARGEIRIASPETQSALLAAMGIEATDEANAAQALMDLQLRDAEPMLPPVHVHYEASGPLEIDVHLAGAPATLEWMIELEGGEALYGRVPPRLVERSDPKGLSATARRRCRLQIEEPIPCGYHTLVLDSGRARCSLIVTPGQCWLPTGLDTGRKLWGVAAQLYLLRSETNWGIGDYRDLKQLVTLFASRGADVIGLNPLHALFVDDPEHASPYSPASRLLLNVLNIDVASLAESIECEAARSRIRSSSFQDALAHCREARLVDYSGVAGLKLPVLHELFACCDRASPEWRAFGMFRERAGPAFERSCLFLALRTHFAKSPSGVGDWHGWPEEFRRVNSPAIERFATEHADAVTFQAWLQFIADSQLRACRDAAGEMAVGLYRDLAVGADPGGAETWANPLAVVDTAQVGAPPDIYNPQGQDWGLPPFSPRALRTEGYRSFIDLVRANMRHAGALRIDHVMALQQLYWVPKGRSPADGAYVSYPLEDLVGILALESHRNRCLVVGEDLGTVPRGFRERMERGNILSYRVIFFEKDGYGYFAPEDYPPLALAVAGSHDLPTLRAWWRGQDLKLKQALDLFPTELEAAQAASDRGKDRQALTSALRNTEIIGNSSLDEDSFVEAAHEFLARTPCILTMLQLDDITGEVDPVNVPTTSNEHANWRRRQSVELEQLSEHPAFISATETLRTQRR
jgi:4-alpha-glucanotransferase